MSAMGPGKGATRPSCLVINPDNAGASARRRTRLLDAFRALPVNTQADLLELIETIAFRHSAGYDPEQRDAREIVQQIYVAAGWAE